MALKKPLVLVVDDSDDDLFLVKMAASKLPNPIELLSLQSGEEALAFIQGEGKFADRVAHPLPALIILDLKMPQVSGFDVLSRLQESKTPKPPFICVMSASNLKADIDKATALGADVYHTKPRTSSELRELLHDLIAYFCPAKPVPPDSSRSN